MAGENYPRTVEEMLEQGWYEKILKKVKRANLKDVLNTPEEIVQDIFLQILNTDYLSRYDPSYRSFEVYIYTMVINSIKKRGAREGSKNGKNIVNRNSIESVRDDDGSPAVGKTYIDYMEDPESSQMAEDFEYRDLINRTRESLKVFKASSSVMYEGKEIQRDPLTVFDLLVDGKSVTDIANIFGTSNQFIYILMDKIRKTKEMQDFHSEMSALHNISSRGKRRKRTFANVDIAL